MPRGGCLTCMHGGSSNMNTLIRIIMSMGVFLILSGILIYYNDLLDIQIQPVSKDTLNTYIGYLCVLIGITLLVISALTWKSIQ